MEALKCAVVLLSFPFALGAFTPPNTAATRWTSNMVLCYMDSRSTPGPHFSPAYAWDEKKFSYILAAWDGPTDESSSKPIDTLFDSFLFTCGEWYDGKSFWPGQGAVTNASDWLDFLDMQITLGAVNLEAAAAKVTQALAMSPSSGGLRPSIVLTIPTPDPRQDDFGIVPGLKRSLNFSLLEDRTAAVCWFVDQAYAQFAARRFARVYLAGFYWYREAIVAGEEITIPALSAHIKSALDPSLFLTWIPYFQTDPVQRKYLASWRELGFDFVTLQPNFAFHNSSADERFAVVKELALNLSLGVELELPDYVRNPTVKNWQASFNACVNACLFFFRAPLAQCAVPQCAVRTRRHDSGALPPFDALCRRCVTCLTRARSLAHSHAHRRYVEHVDAWRLSGAIMRTYYYGNAFVHSFAANKSTFPFYKRLHAFVKGEADSGTVALVGAEGGLRGYE